MEDDSWSQIILEDIHNIFYKDGAETDKEAKLVEAKLDGRYDKGKGKVDEKGNAKQEKDNVDLVDALDLQNIIKKFSKDFNRLLKAKNAKEAKEAELAKVVEVSSDEEDSSNE
ncbi:hypothetical protein Tco_0753509, partial [Tanacetum coccineum]